MQTSIHRPLAAAAAVLTVALVLAACGDSNDSSSSSTGAGGAYGAASTTTESTATTTTTAPATGGASTVKLSADPDGALAFTETTLTAKAGEVTLDMANPQSAGIPHAVGVDGKDGPTAQPGGSSKVTVTLKPGTYEYYCPIPGHREAGMEGTLTVS